MYGKRKLTHRIVAGTICAFLTLAAVFSAVSVRAEAGNQRGNQNYYSNQGELASTPLVQLPLGAVKANGWLENQLLLQKNGITGNMHTFDEYNAETSAWLGASGGESWERGPYYLRGLVALAYALDDAELKAEAQLWIDSIIELQREDGYFGASWDSRWWSRMPVLMAMRDYYEATGETDSRVLEFMEKYFRYQAKELPTRKLSDWADARGGDNIDSVFWFYNRVYDSSAPQESYWLIELAELLYSQTTNWTDQYNNTTVRHHVVNTSQGMKTPIVYFQYTQGENFYNALANGLLNMSIDHGRIDELPNSDEAARDNRSTRGSETCGIVEGLLSTEIAMKIMGEVWVGDRIERLAYNSLPAAYTPDMTGHTYYVLQNQVMATLGYHDFDCDHGDSSAFGAPLGYDCCFSNCHMGWPKFVQNMWMATENNGLAIVAYGPNRVTANVADGKTAEFIQTTDYPFKDSVLLNYEGETAAFELKLRIPEWSVNPSVKINGEIQDGVVEGEYYVVNRTWTKGDAVSLELTSEIEVSDWYNDSVAVEKGPLIYGLKIEEDWRIYDSNDARELKVESKEEFPLREIYPASTWNYGLIVDKENPSNSFEIVEKDVGLQPFSTDTAPIVLKAKGQLLPEWKMKGNLAGPQPYGPTAYDESMIEDIELIPYGSGRLRITHFPKIGEAQETIIKTKEQDSKTIVRNHKEFTEYKNIIVPSAKDYNLIIKGSGSGTAVINSKYIVDIDLSSGVAVVENVQASMQAYIQDNGIPQEFLWGEKQYNNLRFEGADVQEIEVIPIERAIVAIEASSVKRQRQSFTVDTNLDAQETPYKVIYGTQSGIYTTAVEGFNSSSAVITGVSSDGEYYAKVIASVNGVTVESEEIEIASYTGSGGLQPNPNVPAASYSGFPTINYLEQEWRKYDPGKKISYRQNEDGATEIRLDAGSNVKAVLDIENAGNWVDYVVETKITLDAIQTNNCGLMLRASDVGDGPDQYKGYFVGIGRLDVNNLNGQPYHGPGIMIGHADGSSWNDLYPIPHEINANQEYTLKVVVYDNYFGVYLDGELITTFTDTRYGKGTIGLRAYNEAFTSHNVTVRPITAEDLTIFEEDSEFPPYVEANFQDDFSDADKSWGNWIRVGNTDRMNIVDEKMVFSGSNNVKAVAGNDEWSDYVYQVDIELTANSGNGGLLIRTTNETSGADNYYGYYFGIGNGFFEVGKASNAWQTLIHENYPISVSEKYELKTIAFENKLAFYINDELVYSTRETTHQAGKIGLRGYNSYFTADNIVVRPLTSAEEELMNSNVIGSMEISAVSAHNAIQIHYPRISNATDFKILVGTEPGVYTQEYAGIYTNNYKGGGIFSADKVALSVPDPGTYYVQLIALNDNTIVMESNEIEIETGYREDTSVQANALTATLQAAKDTDTLRWTKRSMKRLSDAITRAEEIMDASSANQMDFSLAKSLLEIALATPDSEDILITKPNKNILKKTIDYAQEQSLQGVNQIVKENFETALANAIDVYSDDTVTQVQVDKAVDDLLKMIHMLSFTSNPEELQKLVDYARTIESNLDLYLKVGKEEFLAALQFAQTVLDDRASLDDDYDAEMMRLWEAMLELRFIPDKSMLQKYISLGKAVDASLYTVESVTVLINTVGAGELVFKNPEAAQPEVDDAALNIKTAMETLQPISKPSEGTESGSNEGQKGSGSNVSSTVSDTDSSNSANVNTHKAGSPKTGEKSQILFYILLLSGMAATVVIKKKSR